MTEAGASSRGGTHEAAGAAPARPERVLIGVLGRATAVLALLAAGIGGLTGGRAGAFGALAGVALVALLGLGSSLALVWAAARGPRAALGALGGGVVGRLVVYALALAGLARTEWVAWPSLAGAVVVSLVVTLGLELRELARQPRLFWVEPDAGSDAGPTVHERAADVTRS